MASCWFLVGGLLVAVAHAGNALKCYSYICSNNTWAPSATCAPPQAMTCSKDKDRCLSQRLTTSRYLSHLGKHLVTTVEVRKCVPFLFGECHVPYSYCRLLNRSGDIVDCNVGCCQGDLCNSGPIPSPSPLPTGPITGSDLSCYSCATMNLLGMENAPTDCDRPVTGTCGVSNRFNGIRQDRCLTIKGVYQVGPIKKIVNIRNCSDVFNCNQDFACKALKASGMMESCSMSCCFGKLCNGPGPIDKPTKPSGSSLTCYACSSKKDLFGLKTADADCKNPVKQTCGPSSIPGLNKNQDRCLRMKILWQGKKDVKPTEIEMRNCSGSYYCNKEYICKTLNSSGSLKSCDFSCCFGNLCNGKTPTSLSPSLSPSKVALLSVLSVMLMYVT